MSIATAEQGAILADMAKNKAAVALGKRRAALAGKEGMAAISALGSSLGGQARADNLTAKRRKEIAKKAAAARWGKKAK